MALVDPGAVIVWNTGPRSRIHRVPHAGLMLGRALVPDDESLRDNHVFVERDLSKITARDGDAEVNGHSLTSPIQAVGVPKLVAAGQTVFALVADVRPYETDIFELVGAAANAEDHLSLMGPMNLVDALACHYAEKLGTYARFRPGGDQNFEHFLAMRAPVRTVVLELSRPLLDHDLRTIANVMETDQRLVVIRDSDHYLQWLPPALAELTIVVPQERLDRLAFQIAEAAAARGVVPPRPQLVAVLLYLNEHSSGLFRALLDTVLAEPDLTPEQLFARAYS